jgi:acylphosphatase
MVQEASSTSARDLFKESNGKFAEGTRMVARRVFYEGRVQGVGFRFSIKAITTGYEVAGSVRNLIDGRVEVEVQGEESEVDRFLQAILDSHLRRHIHRFAVHEIPVRSDIKGFAIRP